MTLPLVAQALVARTTPLFLTICIQIYFQLNFFISLLFHLFFLILTCSCQYSCNLMLTSNCMCRPYIDTNKRSWHGLTTPFFSNFLFTNSFSITFLYFFIISSLFPYFNLFMSIFIQSYVNQILSSCLVIRLTYNDWSITNEQRTKSNLVSSQ
jgi:hypothetical protein